MHNTLENSCNYVLPLLKAINIPCLRLCIQEVALYTEDSMSGWFSLLHFALENCINNLSVSNIVSQGDISNHSTNLIDHDVFRSVSINYWCFGFWVFLDFWKEQMVFYFVFQFYFEKLHLTYHTSLHFFQAYCISIDLSIKFSDLIFLRSLFLVFQYIMFFHTEVFFYCMYFEVIEAKCCLALLPSGQPTWKN